MIDHQHGVLAAIPSGDRAVLGDKDETRGVAVGKNKIGAAIENRAGWSGGGTSRSVLWRRDGNGSSAIDGDAYARTGVERTEAGIVVRDPPRAGVAAAKTPWIDKVGVRDRGHTGEVRNKVGLFLTSPVWPRSRTPTLSIHGVIPGR